MAQFGAKRPIFAPTKTTPDNALPTYDYEHVVTVGKLVKADLTVTNASGELYADDAALTEEEYQTAVTELNDKLTSIQTDASALDPNDPDAAKQLLEDMKAPFQDFINITPPASYADAHEKMKSGCQAMIDYLDTVNSMLEETDEGKLQEAANTMMEQLQTAVTDLTEGATMLSEAQQ